MKKLGLFFITALLTLLLVACGEEVLQKENLTVYFYSPDSSNVVLQLAESADITLEAHERQDWYKATITLNSLEGLDLDLVFKVASLTANYDLTNTTGIYFSLKGQYTSFEDAEAAHLETEGTRVHFLNSNNWLTVYAYAFLEDDSRPLGDWPGTNAVLDVEHLGDGWFYVDVEIDADEMPFTIIFNDGTGGMSRQTGDIYISSTFATFVTMNGEGSPYASREDAVNGLPNQPEPVNLTVYYLDATTQWGNLHAYTFNPEMLGTWPGMPMTSDGGDWFKVSLLNANLPLNITFNKGTGGTGNQTADLVLNSLTDVYFYNGTWYPSKQAAEAAIEAPTETKTITVYFYNSDNWAEVHAWGWSAAGDIYSAWPGPLATAVNGKENWFQIDAVIPVTINEFGFLFNNGLSGSDERKTPDVVITGTNRYVTKSGEVFDSFEAAQEMPEDPEEPEEPVEEDTTLVYFFNQDGWDKVFVWAWRDSVNAYQAWPGVEIFAAEGMEGWFVAEIPFDKAEAPFNVIFNNGLSNDLGRQTITLEVKDNLNYANLTSVFATKEEAEEAVVEPFDVDIYYFNHESLWEKVYLYTFSPQLTGNWPGTEMEDLGDGWFKFTVTDVLAFPLNVIFNNNSGEQTQNLALLDETNVYFFDGIWYESMESAEEMVEPEEEPTVVTKVYFFNSEGWSEVYAWAWTADHNLFQNWPGAQASKVEGSDEWYVIDIPFDIEQGTFSILFNNYDGQQTGDFEIDETHIYVSLAGSFESMETAQDALLDYTTLTLYYANQFSLWETVFAYTYNQQVTGNWPGTQMTDLENGWFELSYDFIGDLPQNVIFNNGGNGGQTIDLAVPSGSNVYFYNGIWYESMELAEAAMPEDPVEVEEDSTTVYFLNTLGWEEVYVWAWRNTTNAYEAWPGVKVEKLDESDIWYVVDIPFDSGNAPFNVIFSNGVDAQSQEQNVTEVHLYATPLAIYTTFEDAEVELETETPTIVYFYDAVGWDHIYVWVWRGFDNPFPKWPGEEATPLEGEPGWYYIEVPYSLEFGSFGIVFHNNLTEQSGDYQVAEDKLYATKFGIYESMEAALLSLEEDEEPGDEEPTTSTIYFYNSLAWEEVYVWAWTTNGNLVENWPGILMTEDLENEGWFYVEVIHDTELEVLSLLFTNGIGDQTLDSNTQNGLYFTIKRGFETREEAETSMLNFEPTTTIFVYNSEAYESIYIYSWTVTPNTNNLGDWPGTQMVAVEEKEGWFMIVIPIAVEYRPINFIIHNGSGSQTSDLEIFTRNNLYFTLQGEAYSSFEAVEALFD